MEQNNSRFNKFQNPPPLMTLNAPGTIDLSQLPKTLLFAIAKYLSLSNLSAYCQVSPKVNSICWNEKFWQEKLAPGLSRF